MIAPWAFGALLDAYGTAPGDSGYTAGYLMLAGFCAVGALGAVVFVVLLRRPVARLVARPPAARRSRGSSASLECLASGCAGVTAGSPRSR